jgi:hypothetical protein
MPHLSDAYAVDSESHGLAPDLETISAVQYHDRRSVGTHTPVGLRRADRWRRRCVGCPTKRASVAGELVNTCTMQVTDDELTSGVTDADGTSGRRFWWAPRIFLDRYHCWVPFRWLATPDPRTTRRNYAESP